MLSESPESPDEEMTPEKFRSIIKTTNKNGWIKVVFLDTRAPELHPVSQIDRIDTRGFTTIGQEGFYEWDTIKQVSPFNTDSQ